MSDETTNRDTGGLAGVIRQGITNYMKDVHTALPGKIVSFNSTNQTASIQLLIKRIFKGDNQVELPKLINVPVWIPRAGGFSITFPVKADDECLVLFSERSLDTWFKFGDSQVPSDFRMHSLSDAICLVGMSSEPNVISNYDSNNLQVRNEAKDQSVTLYSNKNIELKTGSTEVTLQNGGTIDMVAPTKVNVTTPVAEFSSLVQCATLSVTGNSTMSGSLNITGSSTASDHVSGGVSGSGHTHGITSGSSTGTTTGPS